jgi:hypothetical protein
MASDPQMLKAFLVHLEGRIAVLDAELAPLESGKTRIGRNGADTEFRWVDISPARIGQIKNEIASLRAAIEKCRHDASDAS